ncbi:MAG: magnesium transporter CorA family protein [Patescibacteria group bacterium]
MQTIKYNNLTWIDINNPNQKDIEYLKENFNFHHFILDELLKPTMRPKVEKYDRYIFMVLHFPIFIQRIKRTFAREIDLLITPDAVITIHYESIEPLQEFLDKCVMKGEIREKTMSKSAGHLIYYIIENLFDFSFRELDHIQQKIDKIESKMFKNAERKIIEDISIVRRDIANFIRTIKPQKTILNSLMARGPEFFGKEMKPYFTDMIGDYTRVVNALENHKEIIEALHDTNESLLTTRTNEIIKVLTLFAVIVFPLTLIAAIFGMNTKILPIVGRPNDFWIVMGIMIMATIGMFGYFKYKKWV